MTAETTKDPRITQLRQEISDTDRALVDLVNKRLRLVAAIKKVKASKGIEFLDPEREQWMLTYLRRANRGPLSTRGLDELFQALLSLTKREVRRIERAASDKEARS